MQAQWMAWALPIALGLVVSPDAKSADGTSTFAVLVFSETAGFRHDSIPAGIEAIQRMGDRNGFRFDATEDGRVFNDGNLVHYREIVFLSTTGEVLDAGERAAFERFIRGVAPSSASTPRPTRERTRSRRGNPVNACRYGEVVIITGA